MEDIDLITAFLRTVGIPEKDIFLVAEIIHTIARLVDIDEQDLEAIEWPGKDGKDKRLLKSDKVRDLLSERERILHGVQSYEEGKQKIREHLIISNEIKKLRDFLVVFTPADYAAYFAEELGSLDNLIKIYCEGRLDELLSLIEKSIQSRKSAKKKQKAYSPIGSALMAVLSASIKTENPVVTLQQIAQDCEGYGLLVSVVLLANGIIRQWEDFDVREFVLKNGTSVTATSWELNESNIRASLEYALSGESVPLEAYPVVQRAHCAFASDLLPEERQISFIFTQALKKVLVESVPKYKREAIHSTHPFLIRPLFRDYPSAWRYAIGGKIASSLETIWGAVGEELFLAMGRSLRAVRNGGIDVVLDRDAYDIKSGPAVMNNDQIGILHIKQRIINEEKRVPGLDNFKVALVYGKAEAMFGTMKGEVNNGNILPARFAWERLTGDPLAPERVYAIAGLIADIVGVPGAIEAVSGDEAVIADSEGKFSVLDQNPSEYDNEFEELFNNAYDPPSSRPEASIARLSKIKSLNEYVRGLLII